MVKPMPNVPRGTVVAAYIVSLCVLPSGVWRIMLVVLHLPLNEVTGPSPHHGPQITGWWYALTLTVVSELLAYLVFGLIEPWGETVPRWFPVLGRRRIPMMAAVIPAGLGAVANTVLWTYTLTMLALGRRVDGTLNTTVSVHGWQAVLFWVCYAPLLLWGPLLGAVTTRYYRRRRMARQTNESLCARS